MMDGIDITALDLFNHAHANASKINTRMLSHPCYAVSPMLEEPMSSNPFPHSNKNIHFALPTILFSTAVAPGWKMQRGFGRQCQAFCWSSGLLQTLLISVCRAACSSSLGATDPTPVCLRLPSPPLHYQIAVQEQHDQRFCDASCCSSASQLTTCCNLCTTTFPFSGKL